MSISVVIPFFNESESILKTLACLDNQEHQPDEVIFVDSGSTDNTAAIINNHIDRLRKKNYQLVYCGEKSPSSSINKGIKESSFELIAYVDCGLHIPPNWLKESLKIIENSIYGIVSLQIKTHGVSLIDKSFVAQTYGLSSHTTCLPGSLIKKSVIEQMGGFITRTRASYDVDFINKTKKNNIERAINKKSILSYFDVNYANSLLGGSKKVFSYSLNAWNAKGDFKPYIYILAFLIFISTYIFNQHYYFLFTYLLARGYIVPAIKSKSFLFINQFSFLLTLPLIGIIIDTSRLMGYIKSYKLYGQ